MPVPVSQSSLSSLGLYPFPPNVPPPPTYGWHGHYYGPPDPNEHKKQRAWQQKGPKDSKRYVGIEIECRVPSLDHVVHGIVEKGLEEWVYVSHGEIRLLASERTLKTKLRIVCDLLKNACVTNDDGLHVHLDKRSRDRAKTWEKLARAQDLMFAMNPSRKENRWCRPVTTFNAKEAETSIWGRDCWAVPWNSRHETFEIRVGRPTVDFKEIYGWVRFLKRLANCPHYDGEIKTYEDFVKKTKPNKELRKYVRDRLRVERN